MPTAPKTKRDSEKFMQFFAEFAAKRRKALGWSRKRLASESIVSQGTIKTIERGRFRYETSVGTVLRLLKGLRTDQAEFFEEYVRFLRGGDAAMSKVVLLTDADIRAGAVRLEVVLPTAQDQNHCDKEPVR